MYVQLLRLLLLLLLTQRTEGRLLDGSQTAVVHGQVSDVERQEHEALQLRQVVVAQLQVEDYRILALERAHRLVDVRQVGRLAQNVQAILLHLAGARRYFVGRRTRLRLIRLAVQQVHQSDENTTDNSQDIYAPHFTRAHTQSPPKTLSLAPASRRPRRRPLRLLLQPPPLPPPSSVAALTTS